jgi:hypothetical protein
MRGSPRERVFLCPNKEMLERCAPRDEGEEEAERAFCSQGDGRRRLFGERFLSQREGRRRLLVSQRGGGVEGGRASFCHRGEEEARACRHREREEEALFPVRETRAFVPRERGGGFVPRGDEGAFVTRERGEEEEALRGRAPFRRRGEEVFRRERGGEGFVTREGGWHLCFDGELISMYVCMYVCIVLYFALPSPPG